MHLTARVTNLRKQHTEHNLQDSTASKARRRVGFRNSQPYTGMVRMLAFTLVLTVATLKLGQFCLSWTHANDPCLSVISTVLKVQSCRYTRPIGQHSWVSD